jgi:hypothetical protein
MNKNILKSYKRKASLNVKILKERQSSDYSSAIMITTYKKWKRAIDNNINFSIKSKLLS